MDQGVEWTFATDTDPFGRLFWKRPGTPQRGAVLEEDVSGEGGTLPALLGPSSHTPTWGRGSRN